MNILRIVSGSLSAIGLFICGVFLVFFPPSLPASFFGTLYFALSLLGVFALLPRLHCWLTAAAAQFLALYLVLFFRGHPDGFYTSYICVHAVAWWLAVGYASSHHNDPTA